MPTRKRKRAEASLTDETSRANCRFFTCIPTTLLAPFLNLEELGSLCKVSFQLRKAFLCHRSYPKKLKSSTSIDFIKHHYLADSQKTKRALCLEPVPINVRLENIFPSLTHLHANIDRCEDMTICFPATLKKLKIHVSRFDKKKFTGSPNWPPSLESFSYSSWSNGDVFSCLPKSISKLSINCPHSNILNWDWIPTGVKWLKLGWLLDDLSIDVPVTNVRNIDVLKIGGTFEPPLPDEIATLVIGSEIEKWFPLPKKCRLLKMVAQSLSDVKNFAKLPTHCTELRCWEMNISKMLKDDSWPHGLHTLKLRVITGNWKKSLPSSLKRFTVWKLEEEFDRTDFPPHLEELRLGTWDLFCHNDQGQTLFPVGLRALRLEGFDRDIDFILDLPHLDKLILPNYTGSVKTKYLPVTLTHVQLGKTHFNDSWKKHEMLMASPNLWRFRLRQGR